MASEPQAATDPDVLVIGGGPAGATCAQLLASWGHAVTLLTAEPDPVRVLANSLPPSGRKLLIQADLLDLVEAIGYPSTGNTVWWGDDHPRVERFAADGPPGLQVDRQRLDPLLLARAEARGVRVTAGALVTRVTVGGVPPQVTVVVTGREQTWRPRLVLDCSGRSSVLARGGLRRRSDIAQQALLGVWTRRPSATPESGDTGVETYADGWAWSVPVAAFETHVGVMIHGARSRLVRGQTLEATYRLELAKARHLPAQVAGATLRQAWACDASIYTARAAAGPGWQLVGDAVSAIDPLSSFGFKKALASAWLAAVAANTRLRDESRDALACRFVSDWEAGVYATNLRQSGAFASEAVARHPSPFWEHRAQTQPARLSEPVDEMQLLRDPALRQALSAIREWDVIRLRRTAIVPVVTSALVHGHEIIAAPAFAFDSRHAPMRYLQDVDLVRLAAVAPTTPQVPDLFDKYCRLVSAVPLPAFLTALAFLVARGVLVNESQA